mmetsp:Transcript_23605/g.36308  ORF Transcript_23605/g.36308 Transcript_23605/m.36308 type:complete len:84 (+) Transcript_23605:662-913(+)|eukprot:CAMPEP_0170513106 /NCGR_PEP_ID=MMETSP0208-20121228/67217_1 /TAXON_ID=197538 /ORGANISM="Strombidium inclinatum, Strain S3" /LENGTH=83 /DNA_ID=CAMNT_0010796803 /DNA_START=1029 /DNA_END=1280 /DNA_ORIENTATION=+
MAGTYQKKTTNLPHLIGSQKLQSELSSSAHLGAGVGASGVYSNSGLASALVKDEIRDLEDSKARAYSLLDGAKYSSEAAILNK